MGDRNEGVVSSTDKNVDGKVLPKTEIDALQKGNGKPLPDYMRAELEAKFGADLSGVQVHTGQNAVRLTTALSAQAFTVGEHICIQAHDIHATETRKMIAHEIAHVMQQSHGAKMAVIRNIR